MGARGPGGCLPPSRERVVYLSPEDSSQATSWHIKLGIRKKKKKGGKGAEGSYVLCTPKGSF